MKKIANHLQALNKLSFGNSTNKLDVAKDIVANDKFLKSFYNNNPIINLLTDIKDILKSDDKESIKLTSQQANDGAEFWAESREVKKEKRDKKTNSLLEKLVNFNVGFKKALGSEKFGQSSSWMGGIVSTVGLGIAGALATALASGALVVGTASFLEGLFKAKDIVGGDITGAKGALKIIGAGISQVISNFTLGTVKSKEVYKFLEKGLEEVQKFIGTTFEEVFKSIKPFLTQAIDLVDKFMIEKFGAKYQAIKTMYNIQKVASSKRGKKIMTKIATKALGIDGMLDKKRQFDEAMTSPKKTLQYMVKAQEKGRNWLFGLNGDYGDDIMGEKMKKPRISDSQKKLVAAAYERHARGKDTSGYCGKGTRETLDIAGFNDGTGMGAAFKHKNKLKQKGFDVIGGEDRTDYSSILNLPEGYNVVFGKGRNKRAKTRGEKEVGHTMITMPNGMEYSDKLKPRQESITLAERYDRPFTVFKAPDTKFDTKKNSFSLPEPKSSSSSSNNDGSNVVQVNNTNNNNSIISTDLTTSLLDTLGIASNSAFLERF